MRNAITILAVGSLVCAATVTVPTPGWARTPKAGGKSRGTAVKVVRLKVHPAKAPSAKDKYHLLPKPKERTPGNAALGYRAAIESLGRSRPPDTVADWIRGPVRQMPLKEVSSTLAKAKVHLVEPEATLEGPHEVRGGSTFGVEWTGPEGIGDYVAIVAAGAADGKYLSFSEASAGSPATPHTSETAVRFSSSITGWYPGKTLGNAPRSQAPCTFDCPRNGLTPVDGLPM